MATGLPPFTALPTIGVWENNLCPSGTDFLGTYQWLYELIEDVCNQIDGGTRLDAFQALLESQQEQLDSLVAKCEALEERVEELENP